MTELTGGSRATYHIYEPRPSYTCLYIDFLIRQRVCLLLLLLSIADIAFSPFTPCRRHAAAFSWIFLLATPQEATYTERDSLALESSRLSPLFTLLRHLPSFFLLSFSSFLLLLIYAAFLLSRSYIFLSFAFAIAKALLRRCCCCFFADAICNSPRHDAFSFILPAICFFFSAPPSFADSHSPLTPHACRY